MTRSVEMTEPLRVGERAEGTGWLTTPRSTGWRRTWCPRSSSGSARAGSASSRSARPAGTSACGCPRRRRPARRPRRLHVRRRPDRGSPPADAPGAGRRVRRAPIAARGERESAAPDRRRRRRRDGRSEPLLAVARSGAVGFFRPQSRDPRRARSSAPAPSSARSTSWAISQDVTAPAAGVIVAMHVAAGRAGRVRPGDPLDRPEPTAAPARPAPAHCAPRQGARGSPPRTPRPRVRTAGTPATPAATAEGGA